MYRDETARKTRPNDPGVLEMPDPYESNDERDARELRAELEAANARAGEESARADDERDARSKAETSRDEAKELLKNAEHELATAREQLDFLHEQLTTLSQQIQSPSAPTKKGEMARLLQGLVDGDDWRHGTWRVKRRSQSD